MNEHKNLQDGKGCFLIAMKISGILVLSGGALGALIVWLATRG